MSGTGQGPVPQLPLDAILRRRAAPPPARQLGTSRQGRPIEGYRLGHGPLRVSLIAGCHADEPVGPALLTRLVGELAARRDDDPLLARVTWSIVPHTNPDGAAANAAWSGTTVALGGDGEARPIGPEDPGSLERGFDLPRYAAHVVREPPGEDVEFGFPRSPEDGGARPENRAVAAFLAEDAPFDLHATLHGMAFAVGPWFLLEPAWVGRTAALRGNLARRVRRMGYRLHDVDRGGEKGFSRIETGFSTRPDSGAMAAYFRGRGDEATAALFRPSSMEHVRSLGGDPLTLVSEMPLFLVDEDAPGAGERPPLPVGGHGKEAFATWLQELAASGSGREARREAARCGVVPMPLGDQMHLQLAFLEEGLAALAQER